MKDERDEPVFEADRPASTASNLEFETDDSEASDLLEMIEQDTGGTAKSPEVSGEPESNVRLEGPMVLESLYFRSFGERPLLTREEEIALAKRIDLPRDGGFSGSIGGRVFAMLFSQFLDHPSITVEKR